MTTFSSSIEVLLDFPIGKTFSSLTEFLLDFPIGRSFSSDGFILFSSSNYGGEFVFGSTVTGETVSGSTVNGEGAD